MSKYKPKVKLNTINWIKNKGYTPSNTHDIIGYNDKKGMATAIGMQEGGVLNPLVGDIGSFGGIAAGLTDAFIPLRDDGTRSGGHAMLSGGLSGAAAGTAIMPGVGTLVGAGVGALTGWLGNKKEQEAAEEQTLLTNNINRANQNIKSNINFNAMGPLKGYLQNNSTYSKYGSRLPYPYQDQPNVQINPTLKLASGGTLGKAISHSNNLTTGVAASPIARTPKAPQHIRSGQHSSGNVLQDIYKNSPQAYWNSMQGADEGVLQRGYQGFQMGGQMPAMPMPGGQGQQISDNAIEIQGDPNVTDGVEIAPQTYVDHGEVIKDMPGEKRVYSDTLKVPKALDLLKELQIPTYLAGKKFSKAQAILEKQKVDGDTGRFKGSNERIEELSDNLFELQQMMNGDSQGEPADVAPIPGETPGPGYDPMMNPGPEMGGGQFNLGGNIFMGAKGYAAEEAKEPGHGAGAATFQLGGLASFLPRNVSNNLVSKVAGKANAIKKDFQTEKFANRNTSIPGNQITYTPINSPFTETLVEHLIKGATGFNDKGNLKTEGDFDNNFKSELIRLLPTAVANKGKIGYKDIIKAQGNTPKSKNPGAWDFINKENSPLQMTTPLGAVGAVLGNYSYKKDTDGNIYAVDIYDYNPALRDPDAVNEGFGSRVSRLKSAWDKMPEGMDSAQKMHYMAEQIPRQSPIEIYLGKASDLGLNDKALANLETIEPSKTFKRGVKKTVDKASDFIDRGIDKVKELFRGSDENEEDITTPVLSQPNVPKDILISPEKDPYEYKFDTTTNSYKTKKKSNKNWITVDLKTPAGKAVKNIIDSKMMGPFKDKTVGFSHGGMLDSYGKRVEYPFGKQYLHGGVSDHLGMKSSHPFGRVGFEIGGISKPGFEELDPTEAEAYADKGATRLKNMGKIRDVDRSLRFDIPTIDPKKLNKPVPRTITKDPSWLSKLGYESKQLLKNNNLGLYADNVLNQINRINKMPLPPQRELAPMVNLQNVKSRQALDEANRQESLVNTQVGRGSVSGQNQEANASLRRGQILQMKNQIFDRDTQANAQINNQESIINQGIQAGNINQKNQFKMDLFNRELTKDRLTSQNIADIVAKARGLKGENTMRDLDIRKMEMILASDMTGASKRAALEEIFRSITNA